MDSYIEFLTYTVEVIVKSTAFVLAILIFLLILSVIFRKKFNTSKISKVLLVIIAASIIECSILVVPRIIDIKEKSIIVMEDATFTLGDTTSTQPDGTAMFYGYGYISNENNESVQVVGVNFFDLSNIDIYGEYHGTMVYAKHSRQFIDYKKTK